MASDDDDEQKAVMVHVQRPPLPWRQAMRTECGLPTARHPVITRDEFLAKVKTQGQRRSAMTTCMTCWDTAMRHPSWQENAVGCIYREVAGHHRDGGQFERELKAIAALISRHADEFLELLEDQREIVQLAEVRRNGSRGRRGRE